MFDERKTAQASAYLINKEEGGKMFFLMLIKMLYLSDRLSLDRYNFSITGDNYFSLPMGPVLSNTYDLIKSGSCASAWGEIIQTDRRLHQVTTNLVDDGSNPELYDELSDSDIEVLDEIHAEFSQWDRFELIENYLHDPCKVPEWQDPQGSSRPIHLETILVHLGKSMAEIKDILAIEENSRLFKKMLLESQ